MMMYLGDDDVLEFCDDDALSAPVAAAARYNRSAAAVIDQVDAVLVAVDEILDLIRQQAQQGSRTSILAEGAAVAARRAGTLTRGLRNAP
jgi:hypothetical protein